MTFRQPGKALLVVVFLLGLFPGSADAPVVNFVAVCQVQGPGSTTPYQGQMVRSRGVVFADFDNTSRRGFFMQSEACDGDLTTSDGIFIYLGEKVNVVSPGDWVELVGVAQEYLGMTEIYASAGDVTVLAQNYPLPALVELYPPWNTQDAEAYFEAREGMYVSLVDGTVVGPTDKNDQTWFVRSDLGIGRVFFDNPAGTGVVICVDDGGLFEINPELKTGDRATLLHGVVDIVNTLACMQLLSPPTIIPSQPVDQVQVVWSSSLIRLATFNLAELFDTLDDPATQDTVLPAAEYQRRLQKRALAIHDRLAEPEVISLQEVENDRVLKDLLARPEIVADYQFVWQNGPDQRGIDVALLYRADHIQLLDYQVRQGCTALIDGLGPDGNNNVVAPENSITCDRNGDGILDGNRLFSRPPLLAHVRICLPDCSSQGAAQGVEMYLLVNHWKSKIEDTQSKEYTLPRRLEEAAFVAALVEELKALRPGITLVVMGDLNDEIGSQPLQKLSSVGLNNLDARVNKQQRYSYIYNGCSQVLDQVLVLMAPDLGINSVLPLHFNADYPAIHETVNETVYRSSDHDPIIVELQWLNRFIYLPIIDRTGK